MFTALSAMAQLPYNTTMTSDHYNDATIVQSNGKNGWDNGIRLGDKNGGGFNFNDKYVVVALSSNGIPKKLTCTTAVASVNSITPVTGVEFIVSTSSDNETFVEQVKSEEKNNSFEIELSKDVKYIKLCYSGNFAGYFKDIMVEELVYCNAPEHNIWEPTDSIGAEPMLGETTMEWCNTEAFEVSLSGEGASQFTASITNNASKGKYGVATISAIYNCEVAGVHEAVLTVTNGTYTYTIDLKGTTLAPASDPVAQEVVWEQDLAVVNVFDTVVLNATAMTEITYAVSDSTIASVEGNVLVLHNAGEVVVYAYAVESAEYLADTLSKTVVVAPLTQEIVWTLDTLVMNVGDTLVLNAVATSGLEISYYLSNGDVVAMEDGILIAQQAGEVVVTAAQEGNNNYLAAEEIAYTITVVDIQTSCENVLGEQVKTRKVVRNGRIYVVLGEITYDVLGNKVD